MLLILTLGCIVCSDGQTCCVCAVCLRSLYMTLALGTILVCAPPTAALILADCSDLLDLYRVLRISLLVSLVVVL